MPTRDGRELLGRLLFGLSADTDYGPLEVVIVDNGSTDGTVDWLAGESLRFPLRVLELKSNFSFAAACNRGAAAADGDRLLFLNNDVEPLEPGWLKRLVTCLDETGAALAGAILVDPALESAGGRAGGVHHRDLCFRPAPRFGSVLEPRPRGFGTDLRTVLGRDRPVAAVTAACALVRRSAFESVSGFCELYDYGKEDVDLCLKLRMAGHGVVASGSTVLLHRRGTTRRSTETGTSAFQERNLRLLLERWGPRLRREYALDIAEGHGVFSDVESSGDGWDAGVAYCVRPADDASAQQADALVRELAGLGYRTRMATDGMGWLLDDVVVHVDGSAEPPARVPGRCNALVEPGRRPRPKHEAARYDVVAGDARQLAAGVDAVIERRGGAPRIVRSGTDSTPPGPPTASGAIFVLGMARTGTSATTRLLSLCGVDVGPPEKLMAPNAEVNAKGFYEHFPLMQVNVSLLRRLGGSWRDLPDLSPGWELEPALDDLRDEVRRLVAEDFAGAAAWTFKDPRTSVTLPFWRPLLGDLRFVICHRHPLEVADSLARRDGLTLAQSLALWEAYTASALAHTSGARRMIVGYAELLDGDEDTLSALTRFVGSPDGVDAPELRAQARAWLDPGLRHHQRTQRELISESAVGERVAKLHLLLELAVRSRDDEPALAGARGGGTIADALDAVARASLEQGDRSAASRRGGADRTSGLEERIAAEMGELARRGPRRRSPVSSDVRFLFVCGCLRSGTSALTTFLNGDDRILLGQERFRRVIKLLEPWHFSEPLFFNPTLDETSWAMPWRNETVFPGSFEDYQTLRERWRHGGVSVFGDKAPHYHRYFDQLTERFGEPGFLFLLRDLREVARSYRTRAANPVDHWPAENDHRLAVDHWNTALANARRFLEGPCADRLLVVPYAEFFGGAAGKLERLYAFLDLELSDVVAERYARVNVEARRRRQRDAPLPQDVEAYLATHGDLALEAEVRALAAP